MKVVLLAGGSGKRLWPLSNEVRSKMFLKLLPKTDGGQESMIQRVCRQLDSVGLLQSTYIVTREIQVENMRNQIDESIPIICEPNKRGTFSAVALAVSYLYSKLGVDTDEIICVIPVDSLVEGRFYQLLRKLPNILCQTKANIALIGAKPKTISNQYGYIIPSPCQDFSFITKEIDYYPVTCFVEKPDYSKAKRLIEMNALWNCGVFAFPLKFMLSYLVNKALPITYEEMLIKYEHLQETSFDHEVVEKSHQMIVIPYHGKWEDLGNWATLTEHFESNILGKGEISNESVNTHIINELPYPIHVIDASNLIVAASPDGILVANKDNSNMIKQIAKNLARPMYEEKRWGIYTVLEHTKMENNMQTLTKKIEIWPGKNISYQLHHKREEIWTIISGSGEVILNNKHYHIKAGDVLQIPRKARHAVKAITPLQFIEVQLGTELVEEDITRIALTWEETIQFCR